MDQSSYYYSLFGNSNTPQAPAHYPCLASTVTTLADITPNQVSEVAYNSYDQHNNPTSVTEYDYGSGQVGAELTLMAVASRIWSGGKALAPTR
jgi:hypothetical protein